MRYTKQEYKKAIENLKLGMEQLEPDGNCCSICGDSGHMAFECGFNPLEAMRMCREISKGSEVLHETLHWLSGHNSMFGVQMGPAKVIPPDDEIKATAEFKKRYEEYMKENKNG